MRALIADDEAPARARLRRLLEGCGVEVIGEAVNGLHALEEIHALQPEVVFLDIEMPELDGIAVAGCLRRGGPRVVFVTAFDDRAVKAFEVAAADYLVKPVAEARLRATVERLRGTGVRAAGESSAVAGIAASALPVPRRLATRSGARYVVVDPAKLSCVLARDHYAALMYEGRELLSEESLEVWLEKLGPGFLRVHRGSVINLAFLLELQRDGDRRYLAVLADGTRVAISRERLDEVKRALGIN